MLFEGSSSKSGNHSLAGEEHGNASARLGAEDRLRMVKFFDSADRLAVNMVDLGDDQIRVAVLGTGNYGSAFAQRIVNSSSDVHVVLASRRGKADPNGFPMPCKVVSYKEAVKGANIVVLAVPPAAHPALIESLGDLLDGKIIVDVSNAKVRTFSERVVGVFGRGISETTTSNAERVVKLLDANGIRDASVVKAFNNISAYTLSMAQAQRAASPGKSCMICGDSEDAKATVALLARRMGFENMDLGDMSAAFDQEHVVFRFFDGWRVACMIALIGGLLFATGQVLALHVWGPEPWEAIPKKLMVTVSGDVPAFLLALSFFPGPMAAVWQLCRGTARRPFPAWFGNWLVIRKQLGLLAFFVCIPHVIIACMGGKETPAVLANQLAPFFGVLSFTMLYIMASCSNSSVSGHFTWAEFQFVFVRVGYSVVALAAGHVTCLVVMGAESLNRVPVIATCVLVLLGLALVLKIATILPPIGTAVRQIRGQQKVSLLPKFMSRSGPGQ